MTSLKYTEKFHRGKERIPGVVLSRTDKHEIIHGERAISKRLPSHLRRPTTDYDIYSGTPKKDARETERALDKKFGFNAFRTEEGQHEGTYKVKSNVNGETYADYTKPEKKIPSSLIAGKRYATLGYFKKHIRKTLKDKEAAFRHEKDRDALNRIRIHERKKVKPRTKVKKKLWWE